MDCVICIIAEKSLPNPKVINFLFLPSRYSVKPVTIKLLQENIGENLLG